MSVSTQLRLIAGAGADGPTDEELLASFFEGRNEAFGELVARHQGAVFRLVRRFVSSAEEAGELTQEVFLKVFESFTQRKWNRQVSFKAYSLRAALNTGLNHSRQKRRWNMTSSDVLDVDEKLLPTSGEADALVAKETAARVRKAALSLSDRQRDVLLLRVDGALSFADIGATLEITEGNAKSHFHLAVKSLRELLGAD